MVIPFYSSLFFIHNGLFFVKQNIKKTSENNFSGDKIQPSLKKNESYENAKQGKKDSKGLTR